MFVDLQKAYDKVPHGALIRKLELIGFPRKLVRMVRALYDHPTMQVRTPSGHLSQLFDLECGVRQGCPSSPVLFNLFVNDLMGALEKDEAGVSVPAMEERVAGLLFADDLVIIAEDEEKLQNAADRLHGWCSTWEMKANVSKCAILEIGKELEDGSMDIKIGEEVVPVCNAYTYLGCEFTSQLDLDIMVEKRCEVGWQTLREIEPFLRDTRIPIAYKRQMVVSVLIPQVLYGGEIWGMSAARCAPAQRVIDFACLAVLGIGGKGVGVSREAIRHELGIAPVHAMASARRGRAWVKFRAARTWIARLLESPFRSRKSTWSSGTLKWLRTYHDKELVVTPKERAVTEATRLFEEIKKRLWSASLENDATCTMEWRMEASMGSMQERGLVEAGMRSSMYAKGFSVVSKLRTRAFRFAPWLAKVGYLPRAYLEKYPACGENVREDNVHLLLDCEKLAEERRIIEPLLREIEEIGSEICPSRRSECDLLLGGGVPGDPPAILGSSCIAGWCCNVVSCSSWSHHCFLCTSRDSC